MPKHPNTYVICNAFDKS
jgi:hypothetical protein